MIFLKKYDLIQLVAVVKSLLKSQLIKKAKNIVATILTLSTVPKKDSLNFLSDYYFDTKSPVAFTSPLALYREAKKRYPSLTFRQVKTWLQSKDTYTLHKPVRYNFPRNRVIVTGIDDQWQSDLVDNSSLARFNKGYKFLLTCIDVFSKFALVVPLKNKSRETLVNEFLNRNFQSFLKEHPFLHHKQRIKGKCGRTFQSHLENSYVEIFYSKEYPCLH